MRDPNRIDKTLDLIRKIWKEYPDLRLGQLIENAVNGEYLYFIEENELELALKACYNFIDNEENK